MTQYREPEARRLESEANRASGRGDFGEANRLWAEAARIGTRIGEAVTGVTGVTYEEYLDEVERAAVDNPEWRDGQAAMNVLRAARPELYEAVSARPELDPFTFDARLPAFFAFVQAHWPPLP